jgi:hypothetical protein
MSQKFASQPRGVLIIERLTDSRLSRGRSPEPDATLAEFLAYLTEPDSAGPQCATPVPPARHVNRLMTSGSRASACLPAELPKLAAQLDDAWRKLRRRVALAGRLSA